MEDGAAYTQSKYGIKVHAATLREVKFSPASFDVILMLHVIEHINDPYSDLCEVFRILKPAGTFICETPRFDSVMFKLLGKRERSLICDGHIYFFETTTLVALARKAGLQAENIQLVGRSLTLKRFLWNMARISKCALLQRSIDRISASEQLRLTRLYMNLRDMQRITFVKHCPG